MLGFFLHSVLPLLGEPFEGLIRNRKSKKDRQRNDQKNDLQNITQKTKDPQHEPH
jgi:hypothetical protein